MIKLVTMTATNENTHSVTCKKIYSPKFRGFRFVVTSVRTPLLQLPSRFYFAIFSPAYTRARACVCETLLLIKKQKFLAQISHVFVSLCPLRKKRRKKLFSPGKSPPPPPPPRLPDIREEGNWSQLCSHFVTTDA